MGSNRRRPRRAEEPAGATPDNQDDQGRLWRKRWEAQVLRAV